MANMNITSPTAAKIYAAWLREGRAEEQRKYLGASIIGHECDTYLWLMFRNAVRESFDGRMYRLFDRGKREEAVFCADLRRIGCEVREFDDNGDQFAVSALGGHFGGHLDGLCKGLAEAPKQWFVTEFKTHSESSFKNLCKNGVLKAKPMHYAQMQIYMGHTKLNKALYMAVNKDNDDLWCEVVDFNQSAFDNLMERAKHIIDTAQPERCATRRDDHRCKACPCAAVCWHDAAQFVDPSVPLICRTCCHATAVTEGKGAKWTCRLGHECGDTCADHLLLPFFVKAEIRDGDNDGINYTSPGGDFRLGKGGLSASELQKVGPSELAAVLTARAAVPESRVVSANTLKQKYVGNPNYHRVFSGSVDEVKAWLRDHPFSDWSKPNLTEESEGISYFEYDSRYLVAIDKKHDLAQIYDDTPF